MKAYGQGATMNHFGVKDYLAFQHYCDEHGIETVYETTLNPGDDSPIIHQLQELILKKRRAELEGRDKQVKRMSERIRELEQTVEKYKKADYQQLSSIIGLIKSALDQPVEDLPAEELQSYDIVKEDEDIVQLSPQSEKEAFSFEEARNFSIIVGEICDLYEEFCGYAEKWLLARQGIGYKGEERQFNSLLMKMDGGFKNLDTCIDEWTKLVHKPLWDNREPRK